MMAQEGSELLFKFPEENSNQASPILPLHRLATDQLRGDLAQLLSDGGAIVYPTDTQYGIAVDPFQKKFFERLFTMKGRDRSQPVSLLVSRPNVIEQWAHIPAVAKNLMKKLWPGQLTLVLPRLGKAPEYWVDENGYIGFRHIAVEPVNKLAAMLGGAITSTSANPSGKPASTTAQEAYTYFENSIEAYVDGGTLDGKPSTVVRVSSDGKLDILREGVLDRQTIMKASS